MRNTLIFSGKSCPELSAQICSNLGMELAQADLGKFSNGETRVGIQTSVREKDVFIVQSGTSNMNDTLMELLVMISACKGGSANKITAVLPYFPYSRFSKKKTHRCPVTARLVANQLQVAGVNHVITVDLHATAMQGFFKCPVDNLHAEPLIARWIRQNVPNWKQAVVVSKNAGGTKRVTSLADALKLNFGLITTDRRRAVNISASSIMNQLDSEHPAAPTPTLKTWHDRDGPSSKPSTNLEDEDQDQEPYNDRRAKEVIRGRLVHGHIVPDDFSPSHSMAETMAGEQASIAPSRASSLFIPDSQGLLGGTGEREPPSDVDEEDGFEDADVEHMVTLVGDVRDQTVFIVDDMIDKPGSWIAAAETVYKRGGAKQVFCIATHAVFGGSCLQQLQDCECIDHIVVTNSFPMDRTCTADASKLTIIDLSYLLSEAIRRNHYGESIHQLYQHPVD